MQVLCASEDMALVPARLLLPVRAVEPAHPSALSSASVCSSAGAYPHFSLFFFHSPTHRSTPPVFARVSDAPSYRHNRHSQFRRQANEAAPFDDLQSLYEEERGRLSYSNRKPNGETHSAQRHGRGGGNSGRPIWEPSNYAPWRSSDGEAKPRYGKPWRSQGRNSSSWASQTEDMPREMHRGRSQQTLEGQRGGKFDMGSRNMESFARRGSAYTESGSPPWERQGSFSRPGSGGAYKESRSSPRERQGSFSQQGSGGAYKESGSSPREEQGSFSRRGSDGAYNESRRSPWEKQRSFSRQVSSGAYNESGSRSWEKQGSFSGRGSGGAYNESGNPPWEKQGSFPRQDAQRVRQSAAWQDICRESSWEGAYTEKSSDTDRCSQRHYNGEVARGQLSSQWSSESRKTYSSKWSGDVEEQAHLHETGLGKKPRIPQSVKNSWPSAPHDYPIAPWQSKVWETEEEGGGEAAAEEEGYGYREAKAELEREQDQNSSSKTEVSPIARIMERLRNIDDTTPAEGTREGGWHSRGELADYLTLPSAKEYLSDRSSPQPSTEEPPKGELDTRFPWEIEEAERKEDTTLERARRLRPLTAAELTIPAPELKRLRILSVHLKQRVKLGKHGVTTDLVNSIMQRFRTCEVVKVKCEGPPAGNMKKTLEILEKKTGGLIIWKAGSVAVLYRGKDFGQPVSEIVDDLLAKKLERLMSTDGQEEVVASSGGLSVEDGILQEGDTDKSDNVGLTADDNSKQADSDVSLDEATKQASPLRTKKLGLEFEKLEEYAMEVEDILTDLGPRYEEWTGPDPIPVDADLLPAVIPNYTPPYRLLPFGIKPNLSNTVATHLRRLCRPLAPHFVIGRDRGLQGLASAMVKLWEKSEIAKIGIKRGILNTNQERIAEDLKQLTGGFFLCRDKNSMTFYRGKDFLPQAVSAALAERHAMAQTLQDEEETGRLDRSLKVQQSIGNSDVKPSWVHFLDPEDQIRLKKEAAKAKRLQIVHHIERKLRMALRKKERAGRELEKVEELIRPVGSPADKETVTDEERFMLRKLGLRMKAFLLVGRRGVFSGVVQNMHLHWKHRELVKIVVKEKDPVQLKEMASMLECESGGILISVDPTSKGYAIVYYRGKNYTRPPELRPPNLLTKRLALKRSLEIQRRMSLSRHIQTLEEEIVHLRAGLSKLSTDSLESREHQVLNEEGADAHSSLKHDGAPDNQPTHIQSSVLHNGLLEKQQGAVATFDEEGFDSSKDEDEMVVSKISKRKLRRLCEMGPIFRAVRLSKTERHEFRNEVLNLSKAAQYMVGKSNPLSTVAKAIRLYFLDHAFIKIGVRNRPHGTSVQDVVEELEDLTGGTVYAQDDYKIILYRGWPTGQDMPLDDLYDVLSLEQCDVLEEDDDDDDDDDGDDEDVGTEGEDDVIEGDNGLMLANTSVKNMKYASDEDEDEDEDDDDDDDDDDLEWDWSDGNTDDEGGDNDDDGDLRWVGLADGNAEEEGDEGLIVDNKEEKNHEGVDTEGDDDDLIWVELDDDNAEEEGGEGPTVDNSCDKEEENYEGVDTEGGLRWDSLVLGENAVVVAGGIPVSFDLDEDV